MTDYTHCLERAGKEYGLILNFDKVEGLLVRCSQALKNADSSDIKSRDSLEYLGCSLHLDGHMPGELKQRLGMARDDFVQMNKIWNHSSIFT